MAVPSSELVVRPALLSDLPQVGHIFNYYITTSTLITRETPLSLVDLTELYRQVKALGLPFLVACPAGQLDWVLGFYFAWPEVSRLVRLPGIVSGAIYTRPGLKGLNLFQIMQVHYMRTLHQLPWFRGVLSENNTLNSTMLRKVAHFKHSAPVVLTGVATKQGQWIDQRLTFIPRAAGEALQRGYEDLLRVKA